MVIGGGRAAERDLQPEFAVAATPPEMNWPHPIIVEFAPPGSPVAGTTRIIRRYHGPDSDDAGTVCAIDAPSVVPAAFVVRSSGRSSARPSRRS
jgi:hypothetical protein